MTRRNVIDRRVGYAEGQFRGWMLYLHRSIHLLEYSQQMYTSANHNYFATIPLYVNMRYIVELQAVAPTLVHCITQAQSLPGVNIGFFGAISGLTQRLASNFMFKTEKSTFFLSSAKHTFILFLPYWCPSSIYIFY